MYFVGNRGFKKIRKNNMAFDKTFIKRTKGKIPGNLKTVQKNALVKVTN